MQGPGKRLKGFGQSLLRVILATLLLAAPGGGAGPLARDTIRLLAPAGVTTAIAIAAVLAALPPGDPALAGSPNQAPTPRANPSAGEGQTGRWGGKMGKRPAVRRGPQDQVSTLAATDRNNPLKWFKSFNLQGGYVAAGVGMRNRGYGTISISGMPANSTVRGAYLYWDILGTNDLPDSSFAQGQFGGQSISGTLVGTDRDPCWQDTSWNFAYRADVTSLVTGNGSYSLTGFASGLTDGRDPWGQGGRVPPLAEGASLVVVYENAGSPQTQVLIYEGSFTTISYWSENAGRQMLEGFTASSPVGSARTTFIGADGQNDFTEPDSTFNGNALSSVGWDGNDPQAGANYGKGNLWDTSTVDVTSMVNPGSTYAVATVQGGEDCLVWVAQVFSVTGTGSALPTDDTSWPDTKDDRAPWVGATRDPVNTYNGSYSYSHTDLAMPGLGPSPVFARSYNSNDTSVSPLGPGWTHNYNVRLGDPGDSTTDIIVATAEGRTDRTTQNPDGSYARAGIGLALVKNANATYTQTDKNQTTWTFDGGGKLIRINDRYGSQATLAYNVNGQLTSVSDPASRGSLTFSYDPTTGRLTSVSDWISRTMSFEYDTNGRLWRVTDREGKVTTHGYEGTSSRLTTITDARGNVAVTNTYDAQGRVATQKDARGLLTGQQTTITYTTNPTTTVATYPATSFDAAWNPREEDTYDDQGRLVRHVSKPTANPADDVTTEFTYDANWFRNSVRDGRGNTTNFCYDVDYNGAAIAGSRGNLTRRIDPPPTAGANRPVTLYKYDGKNNLIQTIPPRGVSSGTTVDCATNLSAAINTDHASDMVYDTAQTKLLSVTNRFTDPELGLRTAITKFEYDPDVVGQISTMIPPRGNTDPENPDYSYATWFGYYTTGPQAGMLYWTADALNNTSSYDYDAVGRQIAMVDPNGYPPGGVPADHTWTSSYDNEDRLRFTIAPTPTVGLGPLVTELRYDEVGNRTVVIDANGQVTKYVYDERDTLQSVLQSPNAWTDPAITPGGPITTTYAYDNAGNLSRVLRAQGDSNSERAVDYAYDGLNRLRLEMQYPSWPATTPTLVTTSTYDLNGNRLTLVDPLNQTTTFGYDALNRLTTTTYSDGTTPNVSYTYDANGNRLTTVDGTGTTTYGYDEAGRTITVTTPGPKTVAYRYDLDGNRTKVIYPDNTAVTYSFDKASRLGSLLDWASRTTSYDYLPDGHTKTITNTNSTTAAFSYDNAQRLTQVWNQQSGTTISKHTYTLDAVGNRTQLDDVALALGTVWAWGRNGAAQIGDGTNSDRSTPLQAGGLTNVSATAAGGHHSLVLKSEGSVWAWGYNSNGQLGSGTTIDRTSPTQISGLTGVTAVAAGEGHSLALKSDGTVWAWGDNLYGELGDGTTTDRKTPVQVSGLISVTAIAAGQVHSLALKSDGTVWAWGRNFDGQLGDGTTTDRHSPVQVNSLTDVSAISGGWAHSVALKTDGTVWAWGSNNNGQLGDGTTTDRTAPVQVSSLSSATAVAAGGYHSLAVKSDGTVWAWGDNQYGQLGDGTTTDRSTLVQVSNLSSAAAVAAGRYHSLVRKTDGSGWGWGRNGDGQLGDGTFTTRHAPVAISGLSSGVSGLVGGDFHSLAVKSDGTVWGWGDNFYGQLGASTDRTTAVQTINLSGATALAAGDHHSLAAQPDTTVWSWGDNFFGQLGDDTTIDRKSPVQVNSLTGVTAVAAGEYFSLARKSDGSAWSWGKNANGQLGDGTTTDRNTPVQVSSLTSVAAVAAGMDFGLALKTDGTVWAWGKNTYGQLGDGTSTQRTTPVQVSGLTNVTAIGAGDYHSLAVKSDGTVWAWGRNDYGQLGDGTSTNRNTPVQTSGLTSMTAVAGGAFHSVGRKSDGTVWAWGRNNLGQLGDGTNTSRTTPVQVTTLSGATAVAAGDYHSAAVKSDGTAWAWGYNTYGQLGDGTIVDRNAPVQVTGPSSVNTIAAGANHNLVVVRPTTTATLTYGYDKLARLTSVNGGDLGPTSYAYDPVGNRLGLTRGSTTSYTYDRADRITAAGATAYTVNASGNLVARGSDSFTYDQANRLKSATVGGTTTTYAFDGDGKRASLTTGGSTTSFVYDAARSLPVVLDDGSRKYVWGIGLAYSVDTAGNVQVSHNDGLGSVRALTDGSGNVVQTYRTDEFGVPTLTEGSSSQPFQFTGEQKDSTGLYYLRARMYDPAVGRFLSRDPLAGMTGQPASLNRYAYAGNNPLLYVDPSGLCSDPGGPGTRYCISRFIPTPSACIVLGCSAGDNRGPDAYGGTARVQQQIRQTPDGATVYRNGAGLSSHSYPWDPDRVQEGYGNLADCTVSVKSRVLDGSLIIARCTATHGVISYAPPIQYEVWLKETDGGANVVYVAGTPYPSMEIWQYSDEAGPKLIYHFDAEAAGTSAYNLITPGVIIP